jgi:hypothetical protein
MVPPLFSYIKIFYNSHGHVFVQYLCNTYKFLYKDFMPQYGFEHPKALVIKGIYLGRHCSLFNLDTVLSRWLYSFESYTIIPLPNYNMPKKEASTLRMLSLVYSKSHTKHCNTTPPIKQNMMHSILCHIDLQCFHLFNHSLSLASFSSMIATDDVPSISWTTIRLKFTSTYCKRQHALVAIIWLAYDGATSIISSTRCILCFK